MAGLKSFLAITFLTQKKPEDAGYVFNTAHHFLYGLTVYKKKTRLAIPIEFILLISTIVMISCLLQSLIDFWKTKWIEQFCFYITLITPIVCSITVIWHRERIRNLSDQVDSWWNYPLLEAETEELKREAAAWMDRFNWYYFAAMYTAAVCCGVLPFQKKFIAMEKMKPVNKLILPMWTPFSIDGFLGFFTASFLQLLTIWFAFFTFGRLCSYLMTVSITISYQMKLIGRACQTSERRVRIMMKKINITDSSSWDIIYTDMLTKEVNSCIIHYQKLYGHAQELCTAFSLITNLTYHGGMWAMCLFGVSIVKEKENPYSFVRIASAIISLFVNQYIYSHLSEALTDELENLRFAVYSCGWYIFPKNLKKNIQLFLTLLLHIPTLKTVMGTKTNMENLSQILNTSYCYFNLILSLKSKISTD